VEYCRSNPTNPICSKLVIDDNTTDIVNEIEFEIDGQWGPYLFCNPRNVSNPEGDWSCSPGLNISSTPADFPRSCSEFTGYDQTCAVGDNDKHKAVVVPDKTMTECCKLASAKNAIEWSYLRNNNTCLIFPLGTPHFTSGEHCVSAVLSKYVPPPPPICNCDRVFKTVGRMDLLSTYTKMMGGRAAKVQFPVGGLWYSHPTAGECTQGHTVGDGSGCTLK